MARGDLEGVVGAVVERPGAAHGEAHLGVGAEHAGDAVPGPRLHGLVHEPVGVPPVHVEGPVSQEQLHVPRRSTKGAATAAARKGDGPETGKDGSETWRRSTSPKVKMGRHLNPSGEGASTRSGSAGPAAWLTSLCLAAAAWKG